MERVIGCGANREHPEKRASLAPLISLQDGVRGGSQFLLPIPAKWEEEISAMRRKQAREGPSEAPGGPEIGGGSEGQ